MKDEKAKYLMIDAIDIKKQLYYADRIFMFNDFENVYMPDKVVTSSDVCDKYNIPEEFKKIIVKVNIPFLRKRSAEEYIMGFPFDMTGYYLQKEESKNYINISNCPFVYDNQIFNDKIKFRTEFKYFKYTDVIEFLSKIRDRGYLELYLCAIKDFFDISVNLDCLLESLNEEKDTKKALIRYKQKCPSDIIYNNKC